MSLLHSQDDSVLHSSFPFESSPSTINIGTNEIPSFSTLQSDAPTPPEVRPKRRRVRQQWTPADDEVLISAWLNTSKDPIVGTDQRGLTFWQRVGEYYSSSPHARATGDKREHLNCKQRWHKINELTNKFVGAYAAAERQQSSGQSESDVLKVAHDIYHKEMNLKFNLEHAWCILRYEQKWQTLNTPQGSGSAKKKSYPEVSSPNVEEEEMRPEGIKAAKARRTNGGKGKAAVQYDRIWEIKKEDFANIMRACIILHNMIVEDERRTETEDETFQGQDTSFCVKIPTELFTPGDRRERIKASPVHKQLKLDLIEHIWNQFGV
ncbi:glutathione S-transferase T3-like [Raphanus sativus]|uniref:Glutathione S-transferase T3-like n=1 Tax=Raphanus sativus TaxID=3726 RepID=A0A6J0L498_RAPSA|nr:glutathione S-transferase T3-like [Raphanus sativus]